MNTSAVLVIAAGGLVAGVLIGVDVHPAVAVALAFGVILVLGRLFVIPPGDGRGGDDERSHADAGEL